PFPYTTLFRSLAEALREKGFGVTEYSGQGRDGTVEIVDTVVRRREIAAVLREIDRWDPTAFVTIEEPRAIRHGWLQERPRERLAIPFAGSRAKTIVRAGEAASADSPPVDAARADTAPGAAAEATD